MPSEKPRFTVIVDDELMKQIDDFRFENRFPNRTAAAIVLLRAGLAALASEQAPADSKKPKIK